jgi:hypothetical protein
MFEINISTCHLWYLVRPIPHVIERANLYDSIGFLRFPPTLPNIVYRANNVLVDPQLSILYFLKYKISCFLESIEIIISEKSLPWIQRIVDEISHWPSYSVKTHTKYSLPKTSEIGNLINWLFWSRRIQISDMIE